MDTKKNRLNETDLLSTQNICLNDRKEKNSKFTLKKICLTGPTYQLVEQQRTWHTNLVLASSRIPGHVLGIDSQ